MTLTRARTVIALPTAVALGAVLTACGLLPPRAVTAATRGCTLRISAPPSVLTALIDRDERNISAQVKALLLTAPADAHIFLRDLDTGNRLGSFTTPPGSAQPGPSAPSPLPRDPTQIQTYAYQRAIGRYDTALRRDQALLDTHWRARLAVWAVRVTKLAAAVPESGARQTSELAGLMHGLRGAAADITSLEHIPGTHLGTRKVLAILDLDDVPTLAAPRIPDGLSGLTLAITGFAGTARAQITWRKQLVRDGIRQVVLMTPATTDELPTVLEPVLNRVTGHRSGGC